MREAGALGRWLFLGAGLAVLAAAFWITQAILGASLVDDAYIFFRYAHNVAAGLGPVFNPGERVEGYSSPLWLAVLAAAAALGADLPLAGRLLGAGLGLATVALLLNEGKRRLGNGAAALIPAWFLATNPSFVTWTWSGMDAALFTLLFFSTYSSFARRLEDDRSLAPAGIGFALATLARPEMLATFPVYMTALALSYRSRRGRLARQALLFAVPLVLPALHESWRLYYYGVPLPNTYYAKTDISPVLLAAQGLRYCAHFVLAYQIHLWITLWSAALFLGRPGGDRTWRLGVALIGAWMVCVASVGGDHFGQFRFFVPVLPVLAAAVAGGSLQIARSGHLRPRRGLVLWAAAMLAATALNVAIFRFHGGSRTPEEAALARSWSEVGHWLRRHAPEDSILATVIAGAIPYYSGLETIDMLGLTDARVARQGKILSSGRVGHQKYDTGYILSRRPDYILYPSSGLFDRPVHQGRAAAPGEFPYALHDLLDDPRTWALYEYRSVRMENGRFVEFLQRKKRAREEWPR